LPDRAQVTMDKGFMRAYSRLLIQTCHAAARTRWAAWRRRSRSRATTRANEAALEKVRADKLREVTDGHDGTWVAHPGLVPIAKRSSTRTCRAKPDRVAQRDDVNTTPTTCSRPEGTRTEHGLRHNVRVGVQYLEAWLRGSAACRSTT
jgi:malate synthase